MVIVDRTSYWVKRGKRGMKRGHWSNGSIRSTTRQEEEYASRRGSRYWGQEDGYYEVIDASQRKNGRNGKPLMQERT